MRSGRVIIRMHRGFPNFATSTFLRCRSGMAAAYTRQHVDCRYIGYLRSACRLAGRTVRLCDGNWSDTGAGWTGTGCSVQQDL